MGRNFRRLSVMEHLLRSHIVIVAMCTLSGCSTLGPRSISPDRFDYNEAYARSGREQVLLNIIRMRYGDSPVFIELTSMLSQYTVEVAGGYDLWQSNVDVWHNQALRAV